MWFKHQDTVIKQENASVWVQMFDTGEKYERNNQMFIVTEFQLDGTVISQLYLTGFGPAK